jgi:hypothetical protein
MPAMGTSEMGPSERVKRSIPQLFGRVNDTIRPLIQDRRHDFRGAAIRALDQIIESWICT